MVKIVSRENTDEKIWNTFVLTDKKEKIEKNRKLSFGIGELLSCLIGTSNLFFSLSQLKVKNCDWEK